MGDVFVESLFAARCVSNMRVAFVPPRDCSESRAALWSLAAER